MTQPPFDQWTSLAKDASFSDPAECETRISNFERRIRFRNITEYGAGGLAMVLFAGLFVGAIARGEMLMALSGLVTLAGLVVVLVGLKRRASNLERRPEDACLTHLQRQYQRQYEALREVPRWYLGPLVPGMALFFFSVAYGVAQVRGWSVAATGIVWPVSISAALFGAIGLANWFAARSLKRKIDDLGTLA